MEFGQIFSGILQPIAIGTAIVLGLLIAIRFGTPRRSPAVVTRRVNN